MTSLPEHHHGPKTFQEIGEEECRSLLAGHVVGRVAFADDEGVQVFPVNHVVHDGFIYFRTSPYSSLANHLRTDQRLSFEVDDFDEYYQAGWSVLVVGAAESVDVHESIESIPAFAQPDAWAAGNRPLLVRIRPQRVTGRRVLPG
jgi:nitroimidazol reductase NimA-like FMN-containing flavoprotein (pyridoxamine 5'-phosphate oxidase superfamily)